MLVGLAALLLLGYELLIRHSFVGRRLHGWSRPWRGMARWKIGAAAIGTVLLVTFLLSYRPVVEAGYENGIFKNDCCGTLELRNGGMILNDKQAVRYSVGRDASGPYILPQAYVGGFEQIGFAIDGTRQVTRLRLDRVPHPTRITLYGGSKRYVFQRKPAAAIR